MRAEARPPAVGPRAEPKAGPRRRGLARGVRLDPAGEEELGGEDEEAEDALVDQGRAAIEDELGADPGAGPIVRLLARQTAVLAAALPRRPRERDDFGMLLGEAGEDGQPVVQGGARGAAAMETLRVAFEQRPEVPIAAVRRNLARALGADETAPADAEEYLRRFGAFQRHRDLGHVQSLLAHIWNLMELDQVDRAHAEVGLAMMALEQVTLDDRWDLAYLLTHQAEPSAQMMGRQPERSSLRPFSRLAEPRWIAAAVGYLRDIDLMAERRRKRSEDGPIPKAPRKGDQGGGKGGEKGT